MLRIVASLTAAGLIAAFAFVAPGREAPAAFACTGDGPYLHTSAIEADAVAVVTALEVGGAENTLPPLATATPTEVSETPTATSIPTAPQTSILNFDLTGYGATVRVDRLISGSLPGNEVEVDRLMRQDMERYIRQLEAGQGFVRPCGLGYGEHRFETGQSVLLFLTYEDGEWEANGTQLLVDGASVQGRGFVVSRDVYEAYLQPYAEAAAGESAFFLDEYGNEVLYAGLRDAPIDAYANAIRFARGEIAAPEKPAAAEPTPVVPTATPQPRTSTFTPPDTGNGGLR